VPVGWILLVALMLAIDGLAPTAHGRLAVIALSAGELAAFAAIGTPIALALDRGLFKESMALFRASG
jgi:hypothetical protein